MESEPREVKTDEEFLYADCTTRNDEMCEIIFGGIDPTTGENSEFRTLVDPRVIPEMNEENSEIPGTRNPSSDKVDQERWLEDSLSESHVRVETNDLTIENSKVRSEAKVGIAGTDCYGEGLGISCKVHFYMPKSSKDPDTYSRFKVIVDGNKIPGKGIKGSEKFLTDLIGTTTAEYEYSIDNSSLEVIPESKLRTTS